jgi:hypothetical protein
LAQLSKRGIDIRSIVDGLPSAESGSITSFCHRTWDSQIIFLQVIAVMRVSRTWDAFKRSFDEAFPRHGAQIEMRLEDVDQNQPRRTTRG